MAAIEFREPVDECGCFGSSHEEEGDTAGFHHNLANSTNPLGLDTRDPNNRINVSTGRYEPKVTVTQQPGPTDPMGGRTSSMNF
jgi:hypothetical protein